MKKAYTCPTCNRETSLGNENPWRPFCSERCRLIDLGEWVSEKKRIISDDSGGIDTGHDDETRH